MDEIFGIVKGQIDEEKEQEIVKEKKRQQRIEQIRKKRKEDAKKDPEKVQEKNQKGAGKGTFGTAERRLYPKTMSGPDFIPSAERPGKRVAGGYISKLPREGKQKKPEVVMPINPNYDYIKKKTTAPIISAKPFKTEELKLKIVEPKEYLINEGLEQEMHSISTADTEFEEFFKAKALWDQQINYKSLLNPKENVVKFSAPSALYSSPLKKDKKLSESKSVGPGSYIPSYTLVEKSSKNIKFSISERLKDPEPKEELPLFPNYNFVLKTIPNVKIVQETEKNQQLLAREAEDNKREAWKSILYKLRNLDLPDIVSHRVLGGVIAPISEIPIRYTNTRLGPGRYDPDFTSIEPAIKGKVKYYEDLIPEHKPRFLYPGPGHYFDSSDSDSSIIGGYIPVSPRSKSLEFDRRPTLDPNYDFNKPRIPSAFIAPEHFQPYEFPDYLGPGAYDPSFKLVEKRTDIDVLPFVQTKEKAVEMDNRLPLIVKDDIVKPGIPGFLYHQPVEIAPPHLPDKVFQPEQWRFYDVDPDKKFDRVPEISFASTNYDEFPISEKEKEILKRINKKLRGEVEYPSVGTYDPEPIKPRNPAFDFGKIVSRDPTFMGTIEEDDKEGDVLILEPYVKSKVPMLVNMDKTTGREELKIDDYDDKTELILEPNVDYLKKRVPMLVNMDKNLGRPEADTEDIDKNELILEPNYYIGKKKAPMLVNMEKQQGRDPEVLEPEEMVVINIEPEAPKPPKTLVDMARQTGREEFSFEPEDVVVVNVPSIVENPTKPRIKGVLSFERMTGREADKEPDLEAEVHTHDDAIINLEKAYRAIEPEPKAPCFDRYITRMMEIVEEPDDIPYVRPPKRK